MGEGKVKGTVVVEVVRALRSRRSEARPLLPEHLHGYLEEWIRATSWYDEQDYLEMMRVVAALAPEGLLADGVSPLEAAGRATSARAEARAVEGAYGSLLTGDPARSLKSFRALWRLRHDTGEVEIADVGATSARVELRDFVLVSPEACDLIQGSLWGFLEGAGASDPRLVHSACRARGDEVCVWDVDWSPPADRGSLAGSAVASGAGPAAGRRSHTHVASEVKS